MKYDYYLLSRIAITRLTSDRFISWRVTRVIFEYCPDLSLVLTRERQRMFASTFASTTTGRSSSSMDSQEWERVPFSTSSHKYSGRRQQGAQTLEKACDPTVRGIVEIWFVLRESLITDGIGWRDTSFFPRRFEFLRLEILKISLRCSESNTTH